MRAVTFLTEMRRAAWPDRRMADGGTSQGFFGGSWKLKHKLKYGEAPWIFTSNVWNYAMSPRILG